VRVGSAQCETDKVSSFVHPTDVLLVLNKNRLGTGVLAGLLFKVGSGALSAKLTYHAVSLRMR